jgi:beta-galactosidase
MDALNHFKPGTAQTNVYNDIVRRFHDALYEQNVAVDIINDIDDSAVRYRAIIIPALYAADDALLARINRYIEQGGRALIGFKSGFSDEHVKVRTGAQPGGLSEACGVHYNQFTLPENVTVAACVEEITCQQDNNVELWMELLTPAPETRTLLRYQHPVWNAYAAATEARFGKGVAMYVGFLPEKTLIASLFNHLTRDLALRSRTSDYRFPVIVRKMRNRNGQKITFIFNYSGEPQTLKSDTDGTLLLQDAAITRGAPLRLGAWDFSIIAS